MNGDVDVSWFFCMIFTPFRLYILSHAIGGRKTQISISAREKVKYRDYFVLCKIERVSV